VLEETMPDLLFEVYSPFGVAGGVAARRAGVPHLLNVHAPLAWEGATYRSEVLREAAEMLEIAAFENAGHIIANCNEMRDLITENRIDPAKVSVIPNGVDVDLFCPEGPVALSKNENRITLGFVSSLKAWHGVDLMLQVFRNLANDPRFHLLVVGNGPMAGKVRDFGEELPGRVTMTGTVPLVDVPGYVRAMDICLAPYEVLEKFYFSPLKVLEYMGAGKPTVASCIGQIPDLIRDGVTGVLVPPGDAFAMEGAIRRLADAPQEQRRMGEAAAREARENHTWSRRAEEIIELARPS
jgi:glycosyltransferase involved in cell wall biosynthesis